MSNLWAAIKKWFMEPVDEELLRFRIEDFLRVDAIDKNSSIVYLKGGESHEIPIPKELIVDCIMGETLKKEK